MGNLKMKIANTLGSKLKEALASDAKLLKKSVPFLIGAAGTWCTILEEQREEEEHLQRAEEERLQREEDDRWYCQNNNWRY